MGAKLAVVDQLSQMLSVGHSHRLGLSHQHVWCPEIQALPLSITLTSPAKGHWAVFVSSLLARCPLLLLVLTLPRHAACLSLLSLIQCFFYILHTYNIPIPKSKDECWEVGSVCILFALQVWGPEFDYPELVLKKINGHMWWLMLVFPALVKKGQRNPRVCWPASLANLIDSRPIRDPIFQTHKVVGT